ncbi:MAG: hypothetical protein Q8K78_07535 [Planctomycetaceae bacterium]|nr:hypothetical protein [Planctomycetaceae bacterium]
MKRLLSLLTCVTLLSSVGCCCMNNRISECDPLASDLAGGGGCLAKFARSHGKKKCHCGHCGYGGMYADPMYAMPYGVDSYGGGGCGCDGGMVGAMPGGGDCGCAGGGMQQQQMIPPAPPSQYAPQAAPTPAPIAEPAPETAIPAVPEAAPVAPMTNHAAPAAPNVQNVSVEEFQRLPGTIISGPTTSTAPAPVPGPMTATSPRRMVPSAAQPGVRPANWQPSQRTY